MNGYVPGLFFYDAMEVDRILWDTVYGDLFLGVHA